MHTNNSEKKPFCLLCFWYLFNLLIEKNRVFNKENTKIKNESLFSRENFYSMERITLFQFEPNLACNNINAYKLKYRNTEKSEKIVQFACLTGKKSTLIEK